MPILIEATLTGLNRAIEGEDGERLSQAKELAELAESEIQKDFPLLHSHAVMGMWGALEAMIEDLAISWMEHNPSVLNDPKLAKIKIPLGEFQAMEQQERLRFLVSELQRDLGAELRSGATKFECLLSVLGLGGPVDKRVKNLIFEAQNLRNVFAHRGGIADRRFVENCPHLEYEIGDVIRVDTQYFRRIKAGLVMYSLIVLNRCRTLEDLSPITMNVPGFEGVLPTPSKDE